MKKKLDLKPTYTQIIAIGFLSVIAIGTLLLLIPLSTRPGEVTTPLGAMFTATSATCVTGLVVYDTYSHWSLFGQMVILFMIQIGGLGFMTVITMFSIFAKRRISLHERKLLMQSAGTMRISGVVKMIRRILIGTLFFEGTGAILLALRFCPKMGPVRGIYNAVFHSVSAFCNAGFDLMGKYEKFSSLTTFKTDAIVNVTIMFLIIIGGIGFLVWNDVIQTKFKIHHYELHSKIVISTTVLLILLGAVMFFLFEENKELAGLTLGEKWLTSFFQSVTPRTAGFNTINLSELSENGRILTVVFMFIGASPGSTGGGIKTTTFIVLIMGAVSSSRHTNSITIFKRRLDEHIVKQASAIFIIYIMAAIAGTMGICAIESIDANKVIFEVVSAIGTVGLSTGITSGLSVASDIILMILMFGGRVGGLTLMLVLAEKRKNVPIERPLEKILIG